MIEHQGELAPEQWEELRDGEEDPFRVDGSELRWREKELCTVNRDAGGRLIAAVGLTTAEVRAGRERFQVAGVGGVFVTRTRRRHGHLRPTLEAALERAATLGPERAMLFCSPANAPLYARFGFTLIDAPVRAGGQDMPPHAMWRPLTPGVIWPPGDVTLPELPF